MAANSTRTGRAMVATSRMPASKIANAPLALGLRITWAADPNKPVRRWEAVRKSRGIRADVAKMITHPAKAWDLATWPFFRDSRLRLAVGFSVLSSSFGMVSVPHDLVHILEG